MHTKDHEGNPYHAPLRLTSCPLWFMKLGHQPANRRALPGPRQSAPYCAGAIVAWWASTIPVIIVSRNVSRSSRCGAGHSCPRRLSKGGPSHAETPSDPPAAQQQHRKATTRLWILSRSASNACMVPIHCATSTATHSISSLLRPKSTSKASCGLIRIVLYVQHHLYKTFHEEHWCVFCAGSWLVGLETGRVGPPDTRC